MKNREFFYGIILLCPVFKYFLHFLRKCFYYHRYHIAYVKTVYGLEQPGIYLKEKEKKDSLALSYSKKFYSCILLNETYKNLNRISCVVTFMSSLSSECLELQYQFCSLVSFLTSVSLE